jgi:hypothetical protein
MGFLSMGIQVMSSVRRVLDLEITAGSGYLKKKNRIQELLVFGISRSSKNRQVS